jgi:hypothetical protein
MPADMPPQPPTTKLPAADPVAVQFTELKTLILTGNRVINDRVDAGFRASAADFSLLRGQFDVLEGDVRGMQSWRVKVDDRLRNNSQRAQATSSVDLAQDAKLGEALGLLAAEKARADKLEKEMVTKEDLAKANEAQTGAVVAGVAALAVKSPVGRAILLAIGGLMLVSINAATQYVIAKQSQQTTTQQQQDRRP